MRGQGWPYRYNEAIISPLCGALGRPALRSCNSLPCSPDRSGLWGLCIAAAALLTACAGIERVGAGVVAVVPAYKIDVVQGNFISKERVAALRPGISRQQVAELLGTPLLTSAFHADRWDYAFSMNASSAAPIRRRFTVFFKGDLLERFEGEEMMSEAEFAAKLAVPRASAAGPIVLEASEESLKAFAPAATKGPAPAASPPATAYPPLEPK